MIEILGNQELFVLHDQTQARNYLAQQTSVRKQQISRFASPPVALGSQGGKPVRFVGSAKEKLSLLS